MERMTIRTPSGAALKMAAEFIRRTDAVEKAMEYCADDDGSCSKAHVDSRELLDDLESLPAADVVPVVRGKWVWDGDTLDWKKRYFCNKCEWKTYNRSNFCPNCGADMREDIDD